MDDDSFYDDIADEDLLMVYDELSSANGAQALGLGGASKTTTALEQQRSVAEVLEGLPSDTFSSPEPQPSRRNGVGIGIGASRAGASGPNSSDTGRSKSGSFRQTTLWGREATVDDIRQSQLGRGSGSGSGGSGGAYRADRKEEVLTHHEIDREAMRTWVYPTNLGAIRDYQFSIVKNSLYNNTLVALPTGLGKTFIAATVMLNFYRWTNKAKIVFVAPTKPLVSQQIDACFHIAGIPRSDTTLLTGEVAPALRADEWKQRRVFFMTPQTLVNDLSHGYADPKSIALIVIDEAHRATGEYAYAKATKLIRRFSNSFRVLALTATPGSKVEMVQEVIDNLGISHCEIRTEESIDIRQYVHDRNIEQVVLDPSDEIHLIGELFTNALKPLTEKLTAQNIWYGRNPMALTTYGLITAQKEWFGSHGHQANDGVKFMMRAIFGALTSLAHSIKLLQFHGIRPFYDNMADFRSEQEGKGEKGSKYRRQVIESTSFQEMMHKMDGWFKQTGFVGHPKLTALTEAVLNHFLDAGEASRVIVFSEYRDSAEEIVRTLGAHRPLVRATTFVGQADGKRGDGMTQKRQIETIERFKRGEHNVLVATSIGEEGLDIGQVDLIICYDASASPIRMLQRMGRTGRKRAGRIVLLLMRGKEEEQFAKSRDNYEKMQKLICEGSRFNFRFDLSTRIVPREIRPEVDKRHVEIPIENTQDVSLPEPKKWRAAAGKKKPPKKFHMPEGVATGFQTLTDILNPGSDKKEKEKKAIKGKGKDKVEAESKPKRKSELEDLVEIPALERVLLGKDDLADLNRSYRDLPFHQDAVEETDLPCMTAHPEFQRRLGPVAMVRHGTHTKRCVRALGAMGTKPDSLLRQCRAVDTSNYRAIPVKPFTTDVSHHDAGAGASPDAAPARKRQTMEAESEGEASSEEAKNAKKKRRKSSTIKSSNTAKGKPAAQGGVPKRPRALFAHSPLEAEETDDDGTEEDEKAGGSEGRERSGGYGINSDEMGDDCERDSDLMDLGMADSDDGSDLMGFVVRDSQVTSSMRGPGSPSSSSSSSSSSPVVVGGTADTRWATAKKKKKKKKKKQQQQQQQQQPYFVPTRMAATPESDSLEDIDELMKSTGGVKRGEKEAEARGGKAGKGKDWGLGDEEDVPAAGRVRGRRILVDSEDESDF
ncbi:ATP-dependent DNA helicase MPH1 [Escovopsis weberi]|uniref:ATP-dependent DNA helicase n=1 Tax=Escovopsis weberi TaxID=150374 RepID=A0A0M8MU02_ESCWE|nr:ATP-dependent DNA helicase MPH1 [Escovopsis weberi]